MTEVELKAALLDRKTVVANMIRGTIAQITMEDCAHILGNGELERYRAAMKLYEEKHGNKS